MAHQSILAYNAELVRYDSRCDLIDYVKHINTLYEEPIDISFMEELLSFVERDDCCIPHTLLVKYGIFSKDNTSQNVKKVLDLYECRENEDFKLMNVHELENNGKHYHKIIYNLTPDTFKLMLMRSKSNKKYARYYLLLEKSIKYYHDYQIEYKNYIISQKDDKIDQMSKKIDELLSINKEMKYDLSSMIDIALEQAEQKEISEVKISTAVPDRINSPPHESDIEQLVIYKQDSNLYVTRGTMAYVSAKCKQLCGMSLKQIIKEGLQNVNVNDADYTYLRYYKDVPNARHLFRVVKDRLTTSVSVNTNYISSTVMSLSELLDEIQLIFDQRLTVNVTDDQIKVAKTKAVKSIKSKK